MKNICFGIVLAGLLLIADKTQAQVRLGLKAGINSATLNYHLEPGVSVKPLIGFQGGLLVDIPMANAFSLQPALLVSTKGTKVDAQLVDGFTGSIISPVHNSINLVYAEIPVLAMFRKQFSRSLRLYGGIGPYVGIGLGGRTTSTVLTEREVSFGSGASGTNTYRRLDYGASAAGGFELNRLVVGVNYNYGLIGLTSSSNPLYHRTLGITLGYWLSSPR